jgi:hypothetical protein
MVDFLLLYPTLKLEPSGFLRPAHLLPKAAPPANAKRAEEMVAKVIDGVMPAALWPKNARCAGARSSRVQALFVASA